MSDPVVAAVRRAVAYIGNGLVNTSPGSVAEFAAREMGKPLRALHYKVLGDWAPYCAECWGPNGHRVWPCDTARLIYTTEELNDE